MGGHQVTSHGSGDDGYDEDGYDESQRAEILEATRDGPTDGTIITDLDPDLDEDDEADEDQLSMTDGEVGEETTAAVQDEEDLDEDDLQEDFDDDTVAEDDLDDRDDTSLRP